MKPKKADIDFLINEKKRPGHGRPEDQNFELPGNLSSDDFEPQEGLPDLESGLFSEEIAEKEESATDEGPVRQEVIEPTSQTTEGQPEELEFDISDALILPEFKEEPPVSEESEETADFSEPLGALEQSSHQEQPFILEPSSEEPEENLDDSQLSGNEDETPSENTVEDSAEENLDDSQLSGNEDETPSENTVEDSAEENAEETLSFLIQPEVQPESEPEQAAEDAKHESDIQENLLEEQSEVKPEKDEKPIVQKVDAPLVLSKKSVLEDFIAQKASQKDKPFRKAEKPQPKPKPKKQSALKTSIPLSALIETSSLIGLDIGMYSVKYAQLKKTVRGLQGINFGSYPVPDSPTEMDDSQKNRLLSETLQKNLQNRRFKNTLITSAVYGLKVLFKNIKVPKTAQKELAKAVPWACRKDLPFPVESTVFAYKQIDKKDKSDEKLDIFVVAAQKDLVSSHIEMLEDAQIVPSKVSTVPIALWNLCKETLKKEPRKCFGLIDIGANSSHIIFIKNGLLEFARQISTGAGDFTEALTGAIFVSGAEITLDAKRAESIKRKYGFPDESEDGTTKDGIPLKEVSALMGPVLEKLVSEIQRTIEFFKEKFEVDALECLYLTGGGALMKNMISRLSLELNLEIEVLNPFKFISFKKLKQKPEWHKMGPRFAVPIGLALDRQKEFNLLPAELRGSHAFQYLKRVARYGFSIMILLMALLSQNVGQQFKRIRQEFIEISTEYDRVKPRRERFLSLQRELKKLNVLRQSHADMLLDINLNAVSHLKAFSQLVPRNIALTSFKMSYDTRKIEGSDDKYQTLEILRITGVAFENNSMEGVNLAKFLLDLEKSDYFYAIDLKSQKIREDGGLEFSIEFEI
ncbi:type IV pilus assembly protein PilM [candidate division KSB1 bacterium]|nr:type IV pilus assembly protein PilM [candidate division KSB1 bacterium]